MASTDGSIILSVAVDTGELDEALDELSGSSGSLGDVSEGLDDVSGSVGGVTDGMKSLGKTVAKVFTAKKIFDFSKESAEAAIALEANTKRMDMLYGNASDSVKEFVEANANAFGMSKADAYAAAAEYGNIFTTFMSGEDAAGLTTQMLEATAVITSQTGRTYGEVFEKIRSGLYGNTRAIDDLGISVRQSSLMQTEAYAAVSEDGAKSWNDLTDAELQNARAWGILEQAQEKYGDGGIMESTALSMSQFQATWDNFKATFGEFINEYLEPVLSFLTTVITKAVDGIGYLKELVGITGEGEGENGENGGALSAEEAANAAVTEVLAVAGVCVLVGIMLLLFGKPLYGVALIGMGIMAYTEEAEQNPEAVSAAIQTFMEQNVEGILALAAVCVYVGIILIMFDEKLMWRGIALISMGIGAFVAELAANPEGVFNVISEFFQQNVAMILGIAAMCIVVGILLVMTNKTLLPRGVALIAAGVVLVIAEIAFNYDAIYDVIKEFFQKNWEMLSILAVATIGLGIIIIMCGMIPQGIALIVAGIATLVAVIAFNFDAIKEHIKSFFNTVKEFILTYGQLILGVILILTGVGIPFGIKLIYDWIKENYGKLEIVTKIVDKVKEIWEAIKDYWYEHIAKIFTLTWWKELAIKCGNGISQGFAGAINGVIGMFENMINWIIGALNKVSFDVPDWVPAIGGKSFGFNLEKVTLKRVQIPELARGAVIPANREFLAVLGDQKYGTNIEAPAELIKQMAKEAINEQGMSSNGLMLEIANRLFSYQDGILQLLTAISKENGEQRVVKEEHYNLDKQELMRIVYSLCQGGERLQGSSFLEQLNSRVIVKTRKI